MRRVHDSFQLRSLVPALEVTRMDGFRAATAWRAEGSKALTVAALTLPYGSNRLTASSSSEPDSFSPTRLGAHRLTRRWVLYFWELLAERFTEVCARR